MMKFVIIIFLFAKPIFAERSNSADIYFTEAVKLYLEGNLEGAIKNGEYALELDKENKKYKAFLIKVLTERAEQLYSNKLYKEVIPYLKKAMKLAPENEEIKEMYEIAVRETSPKVAKVVKLPGGGTTTVITETSGVPSEREKMMASLLKDVQKQQDKMIEALAGPNEIIRKVIEKSDAERRQLLNVLQRRDLEVEKLVKGQKSFFTTTLLAIVGGGVLGVLLIILLIMRFVSVHTARREAMMMQAQERILQIAQQQQLALAQGRAQLQLSHQPQNSEVITPKEMLNDPNPRVRAKGIEVIEAELEKADKDVAERILEPFLNDRDNRVRANACKVLYKYNPEKAFETLQDMIKSSDKWMRVSAAWALGEINDGKGTEILLPLLDEEDYHLKRMVLRSLKKIVQTPDSNLEEEKKKEIMEKIKEIAKKEGWVL